MLPNNIELIRELKSNNSFLVMGLSGWMNENEVSPGSVVYLVKKYKAEPVTRIQPDGFYIYQIPSSLETTNQFRPMVDIREGVIQS